MTPPNPSQSGSKDHTGKDQDLHLTEDLNNQIYLEIFCMVESNP